MNVNLSGEVGSALSVINSISEYDMMLLSEPILDINKNNQYTSKQVKLNILSNEILSNIKSLQKFGSMAYVDKDDYALTSHNHNDTYNKVTISTLYSDADDIVKIGTLTIDGVKNEIYTPKMKIKKMPEPLIGQLKFIHHTNYKDIDIYSKDFDGWVYADGSEYECEMFEKSISVFNNDGITFTVPTLNNFIKPNPFPYKENNMSEIYNHIDPIHSHRMLLNLSGNVNGEFKYGCNRWGTGNSSHGVNGSDTTHIYDIELDYTTINVSTRSKDYIHNSKSEADETYPSHNTIPVMVYIGLPSIVQEEEHE